MSYERAIETIREYVSERGWTEFHSEENLAKSISIEAAELLQLFQWSDDYDKAALEDELADVLTYAYLLADRLELDPNQLVVDKAVKTRQKYPVSKAFGVSARYDQL